MNLVYIYGLREPDAEVYHYVGHTTNPLRRFSNHLQCLSTGGDEKNAWIKSCVERGFVPVMDILHILDTSIDKTAFEAEVIIRFRAAGHPLINAKEGGQRGSRLSAAHRQKISEGLRRVGYRPTPQALAAATVARRARHV